MESSGQAIVSVACKTADIWPFAVKMFVPGPKKPLLLPDRDPIPQNFNISHGKPHASRMLWVWRDCVAQNLGEENLDRSGQNSVISCCASGNVPVTFMVVDKFRQVRG